MICGHHLLILRYSLFNNRCLIPSVCVVRAFAYFIRIYVDSVPLTVALITVSL